MMKCFSDGHPSGRASAPATSAALAALMLSVSLPGAAETSAVAEGNAFDLKTGELLYREEHFYPATDTHRVIYREPDGNRFAGKFIDYSRHPFTPNVSQHNDWLGEIIELNADDDGVLTSVYRARDGAKLTEAAHPLTASMVADTGFNRFIHARWDSLLAGDKIAIDYFVPFRQRTLALVISREACAQENQVCFRVAPANWLVAAFVQPLHLVYGEQRKRLLEFRGTSNIAGPAGDYLQVRIEYRWRETELAETLPRTHNQFISQRSRP